MSTRVASRLTNSAIRVSAERGDDGQLRDFRLHFDAGVSARRLIKDAGWQMPPEEPSHDSEAGRMLRHGLRVLAMTIAFYAGPTEVETPHFVVVLPRVTPRQNATTVLESIAWQRKFNGRVAKWSPDATGTPWNEVTELLDEMVKAAVLALNKAGRLDELPAGRQSNGQANRDEAGSASIP